MAESEATQVEDVKGEITTDIFADEAEQTATEESSTEETKTESETKVEEPAKGTETEAGDEGSEEEAKSEESEEAKSEETATEGEETETTETEFPSAEKRKAELNAEIRRLNTEQKELEEAIARRNAEFYKPLTEEQLIEAGATPEEAEVTAREENVKLREFNMQIAQVNTAMEGQAAQVMHDFPEFDPRSPEFNEDLWTEANELYKSVSGTKVDEKTGLIYDVAVLPYQIYQRIALTHRRGAESGQVKGQKSTEKMLQAAETPSSAAPKPGKKDKLLELWED